MNFEFRLTRRIEFAETDLAGIVHFSNFFRMMEATEHAFFRSLGTSVHVSDEGGTIGWPRVNASCDYARPLRFEEEVEIHLLIAQIRTRSIRYEFIFRKVEDGSEVARGKITAVCAKVDRASGKLVSTPIPERLRGQIAPAPAEVLAALASATGGLRGEEKSA